MFYEINWKKSNDQSKIGVRLHGCAAKRKHDSLTVHRLLLKKLLTSYFPSDPREQRAKSEMLFFLNDHPDCFERSLIKGHFTASGWVLNPDRSKALLMHHAKLDKWLQLGGHSDGNPDLLNVAMKEVREESGIEEIEPVCSTIFDIDIHLIPANSKEMPHYHYDVRFLIRAQNEKIQKNQESKELLWIDSDLSNLPEKDPSILRMFYKWQKLKTKWPGSGLHSCKF